ncbi:MAG TPA: FAD-linked oxidase C-terminal domain-containing protein [Tepidisphaeraceae bacterium]|nr:FAD-linked oxidase C-terminal domain-containing protein [Tepidisphaeraceae bacterium]
MLPWVDELKRIVGSDAVMTDPAELFVYESDGFTIAKSRPGAVVFPRSIGQVQEALKLLKRHSVPIVPRGSGTGLTGGCITTPDGAIISTVRMNRILRIDVENRVAHVEAGVRNTALSEAVARTTGGEGLHFSPDPSSQRASTLGGNAATNAGGIHVLKDFVTSNHVLGLEMVLADGSILRVGAENGCCEAPFDLPGLICGCEGTFGVITSLWLRLTPRPSSFRTIVATFASRSDACNTVSDVIGAGHLPAAMEMLDGQMVRLIETTFHLGIRADAEGLILCEIDGIEPLLDAQMNDIVELFRKNNAQDIQTSGDPEQRAKLWKARKSAFGAIGKISPSYCTQDACVPRSMLAGVLDEIEKIGNRYGLQINSIFHAGDGNIHPIFLYDERDPQQVSNTLEAAEEVLKYCIDIGGTVTGEHGVGIEKLHLMPYYFDAATMQGFADVKACFEPEDRINAGKLIPSKTVQFDMHSPGRQVPQ